MIVEATMDNMGNIILTPRSRKVRAQMRRHNKEWVGHPDDDVFLQEGMAAEQFLESLTPRQRADIESGWDVAIRMDPWEFGHYVGYDFHEVINP